MLSCVTDNVLLWMLAAVSFLVDTCRSILDGVLSAGAGKRHDLDRIPGPLSLPVLGTSWIYMWRYKITKIHEAYEDMTRRYGKIVKETPAPGFVMVSLADRKDIEKVLRYPSRYPFRPPSEIIRQYRLQRPDKFASGGLAHEQGEKWHELRTKTTGELTSSKTITGFLPELNVIGDDFMDSLKCHMDGSSQVDKFFDIATKYGLETCCTLVLGQRMMFMNDQLSDTAQKLSVAMQQRFIAERDSCYSGNVEAYMKTSDYAKFVECEDEIYRIVSEIVDDAKKYKENEHDDVKSILMSVIERPDLDDREKRSALIDFVAAGIATLSSTLTFIFYLLSKNPICQEKIFSELEEIAPNSNHITATEVAKMSYTKACMFETFRLIPIAFGLTRILEEDMTLSGYKVPAGTVVMCHTMIACQSEDNFTNAKEYIPERWLGDKESQSAAAGIFAPFGIGRRMCPGKRLMEQAILITLAKAIREYTIEFDGDMDVQFEFILRPKMPVGFRFKSRC